MNRDRFISVFDRRKKHDVGEVRQEIKGRCFVSTRRIEARACVVRTSFAFVFETMNNALLSYYVTEIRSGVLR